MQDYLWPILGPHKYQGTHDQKKVAKAAKNNGPRVSKCHGDPMLQNLHNNFRFAQFFNRNFLTDKRTSFGMSEITLLGIWHSSALITAKKVPNVPF